MNENTKMICPCCGDQAVFEAVEPISVKPVVENWTLDRIPDILKNRTEFACLSCEGLVRICLRSHTVSKINRPFVFDDFILSVKTRCRSNRENTIGSVFSSEEIKKIKRSGLPQCGESMSCQELLVLLVEMEP